MDTQRETIYTRLLEIEQKADKHGKTYTNERIAKEQARHLRTEETITYITDLMAAKDREINQIKAQMKAKESQQKLF